MSDFDRFAEFLRREARGYNEAPRVPADVMWRGVEGGLGEAAADRAEDELAVDVRGYNDAPPAPRAEMWGRIEAAWALRAEAGVGGVGGVVGALHAERPAAPRRWPAARVWRPGRRGVAGWAAALAAAASLVLGIALGRDARPSLPGEAPTGATVTTLPSEPATSPASAAQPAQSAQPAQRTQSPDPELQVLAAGVLPIPAPAVSPRAAAVPGETDPPVVRVAEDTPSEQTAVFANPFRVRRDHETTRYLGRAETLLTAFRIDQRTPASEMDLAMWARELLIETRMRLDLPVARTPEESALLTDLELILLQISRLRTGVPHVEWQLARESMELKGTLPRLRAVSATDGL